MTMSTIQQFQEAADKATQASAQADAWANGPINATVTTDSGPVPTIAEFTRAAQERADAAIEALGWVLAGDFTAGCTVTERNQYVLVVGGAGYRWDGVLPKVVAAGSSPTPIATGSWVLVGDMFLRGDLAAASGSGIVGFQQAGSGSVPRTSQEKMREVVSVEDFTGGNDAARFSAALAVGRYVVPTLASYSLSSLIQGNIIQLSHVTYSGTAPINRNVGYGCNIFSPDMTSAAINNTAIGDGVMSSLVGGAGNTGTGRSSLKSLRNGINNTANGYNSLLSLEDGGANTAMGRNSLLSLVNGDENSAFGNFSQAASVSGQNNSSFGRSTLEKLISGSFCNAFGATSQFNQLTGQFNNSVGCSSLYFNTAGKYNAAFGTDSLYNATGDGNSAFGDLSGRGITTGQYNCAFGRNSMTTAGITASFNCAFGHASMGSGAVTGNFNCAFGQSSLTLLTSGVSNSAFGSDSLGKVTTGIQNTALGNFSLNLDQAGNPHNYDNCTGVGHSTRVSGSNQVQLGNATTTTYVYGTVQNRSDSRDKTDVRDTELGINFILGLRPVDGRWDMRDDYKEEYQAQIGIDLETSTPIFETRIRELPKDGSKARNRFHHWFVAQEVKELCDKLGVDFGGYQDHSLSDGCDVKTLGYDEFIPPTVKAVQECWARLDALENRIATLEAK